MLGCLCSQRVLVGCMVVQALLHPVHNDLLLHSCLFAVAYGSDAYVLVGVVSNDLWNLLLVNCRMHEGKTAGKHVHSCVLPWVSLAS